MKTKSLITTRLMSNGQKRTSEKVLLKTLKLIMKTHNKKGTKDLLKTAILNSSPVIYLKQIKRKKRATVEFPFLLNTHLRLSYGVKLIISNSNSKKLPIFKLLNSELVNSSKNLSISVQKKQDLHKDSFLKKKFANYRWF